MAPPVHRFAVNSVPISVYAAKEDMGRAAAHEAMNLLRDIIARRGAARIIVGTGPSQQEVIAALSEAPNFPWSAVEVFHMDEYIGLPMSHPASLRRWLKTHFVDTVQPGRVHYLQGDAPDVRKECDRYRDLLRSAPIDLTFLGFGENGHIAFNDPHSADFADPLLVKRVVLDARCRLQQVGEGHFSSLSDVPREAITLTCPALMTSANVIACIPDSRKAEAVRNAIEGPLCHACPASVVFTRPAARIYLDVYSASLLTAMRGRQSGPLREGKAK
jgi:glucosamine-6-phosphate deaminase